MATMPVYPDPSNHLRSILRRASDGTLPIEAATFATAALAQVTHLHFVIEDLENATMSTNGPEEALDEITTEAQHWLHQ